MIIINTDLHREYEPLGIVTSTMTCTGAQNNNISSFIEQMKDKAIQKMIDKANALQADGIINIQFSTAMNGTIVIVSAVGTAIKTR